MKRLVAAAPESDPALQRLFVETRERQARGLLDRERAVELLAATTFLAAATSMAALMESGRGLDVPLAVALLLAYALAARVEFPTGSCWTMPTQLVFVPMLFLLPTEAVPLLVATGLLLAKAPEYATGAVRADRAVVGVADAWHAVGPALVLLIADSTAPAWGDWPIYLMALASQFAFQLETPLRVAAGVGVPLRTLFEELRAIYMVDALLSPIGLLTAFAAAGDPGTALLVLPLIGLIAIFAKEREARIEGAMTLSAAYRGTALLLGELLSTSDEYTGSHSRSVVVLAHQVGTTLGLDERELREIEFGALLHDVGKMSVPNEILNKPGRLTEEEMALMRTHTLEGEEMLDRIGGVLGEVGQVVRSHHERWDGTGYPDGLAGEEIPVVSRIISCCDAFNAMTTDRSYRAAMPVEVALEELRAHSGTQFDPAVVDALIEIVESWQSEEERRLVGNVEPPAPVAG